MFWVLGEVQEDESDTRNLEFDLIKCSLENVISIEKPLYDNHMLNEPKLKQEPLRSGNSLDLGTSLCFEKGL